jgi:hypothetical protein
MTKPPLGAKINWAHPLAKGIVGCWLFNEGMGDKVYDLSGNGNTGTLTGFSHPATVTSGWNPGKFGKMINFDGTSNKIVFNNITLINDFTFNIFYYLPLSWATTYPMILTVEAVNTFSIIPGHVGFLRRTHVQLYSGGWYHTQGVAVPTPGPHMISVTAKCAGMNGLKLYEDGNFISQTTMPNTFTLTSALRLGMNVAETSNIKYNGGISHVILYNIALSSSSIQQLYTSPFCFIN